MWITHLSDPVSFIPNSSHVKQHYHLCIGSFKQVSILFKLTLNKQVILIRNKDSAITVSLCTHLV